VPGLLGRFIKDGPGVRETSNLSKLVLDGKTVRKPERLHLQEERMQKEIYSRNKITGKNTIEEKTSTNFNLKVISYCFAND